MKNLEVVEALCKNCGLTDFGAHCDQSGCPAVWVG